MARTRWQTGNSKPRIFDTVNTASVKKRRKTTKKERARSEDGPVPEVHLLDKKLPCPYCDKTYRKVDYLVGSASPETNLTDAQSTDMDVQMYTDNGASPLSATGHPQPDLSSSTAPFVATEIGNLPDFDSLAPYHPQNRACVDGRAANVAADFPKQTKFNPYSFMPISYDELGHDNVAALANRDGELYRRDQPVRVLRVLLKEGSPGGQHPAYAAPRAPLPWVVANGKQRVGLPPASWPHMSSPPSELDALDESASPAH
ncbi:hypothetical protein D7B24_006608 [Verticillium nonalfalfae]|uniref:Uncharacterized protein n=1 Tax=Verticillium nonalfalfae TaxID=1051616 RepID=A0A3M9YAH1_9PEZI|nr:uncharacterized protein D7B24_006608 [Verticillium nonalfalfae]RNJ56962.1 hypothetical protein D7B24_006608 [Verticillium nonalfalfae]